MSTNGTNGNKSLAPGARADGFMNVLSGLGAPGLDRTVSTFQSGPGNYSNYGRYAGYAIYGSVFVELYMTNGLAQKIIDRPSDDAFQSGVEIEGDVEELMSAEIDRLQILAKMADAVRWARLYGGSALLLIAMDGGDFTDPLNLNTLDSIQDIKVLDGNCIKPTEKFYTNMLDPLSFGKMEYYSIICPGLASFEVHESRLIPMSGDPRPYGVTPFINRVPWIGRPVLEACYSDIIRYSQGLEWTLRLLERKQQAVYRMAGLGDMFAQGDDDIVRNRINMVDLVRGNLNSVVVDKEDEYNIQSPGMEGTNDALQEFQVALAASSNFPQTILFGKPTKGLNQTGSSDLEAYYGMVSKIQNVIARPMFEKLVSILWLQSGLKNKAPDDWEIKFQPLWVLNELELSQSTLNEKTANGLEATMLISMIDNQIMSPEEVRMIMVGKYPDFDFSPDIPDTVGAVDYAAGVDNSLMDVTSAVDPAATGGT